MPDVVLVTCRAMPDFDPEHAPIQEALSARGLSSEVVAWDAPYDWAAPRACVLRSTWDYHLRREEFLAWADLISQRTRLFNPAHVVRWNTHKGYLRELERRGVPVLPTEWVSAASLSLAQLCERRGWRELVVKPAVSAGAYRTKRFGADQLEEAQRWLGALSESGDVLVQPYAPQVETSAERSILWIDGALTHAAKRPPVLAAHAPPLDAIEPVDISSQEELFAHRVVAPWKDELLYARVDYVLDDTGEPRLMELELVEPSLFLRLHPRAADQLAHGIARRLRAG